MADKQRKCSVCSTDMLPWDNHQACIKCRGEKKGKDRCKEADCPIFAGSLKIPHQKKSKTKSSDKFDDSLLDEPTPPKSSQPNPSTPDSSVQDLIKNISPQEMSLKAPKLPDSYFYIARVKTLSASISVHSKQHIIQETVCRENVQTLGHVVWFKMAIEELNNRIQELATEMRSSKDLDTVKESADLMVKYSQLQASDTYSLEIALDIFLKQNMTLVCHMLLARRDSLLKDCSSKLRPKDLANLRTDHFDQQELFNSDILSQVEDNMIKRLSIIKESDTKPYRDTTRNFDFGRSSHSKNTQESNKAFCDKRTQPNTSYGHFSASASRGGRGEKRK